MVKKVLPVLLLLMLLSFPLFGVTPESWVNTSLSYDWAYESALELTSGKTDTLGYDVSWFGFPAESDIGMETRFGMGFSIDAVPAFTRMNIYVGPVFTETLAYGVTGFVSLGPSYTISGYDAATGSIEQQLGMGMDLGARFKFSGNERFDFGLIAGVFADVALLHIIDETRATGISGNVIPYIGFSFGSAFRFPYYGHYGFYDPLFYYY